MARRMRSELPSCDEADDLARGLARRVAEHRVRLWPEGGEGRA